MTKDVDVPDPQVALNHIVEERNRSVKAHDDLRASQPYIDAIKQVDRCVFDYALGMNAIDLIATRRVEYFDELISLRIKPHLVQSVLAASQLIKQGFHDPARREMRFLVEASVKALWLDQGSPQIGQGTRRAPTRRLPTVAEKVGGLDGLGRERFHEVVDSLQFGLLDTEGGALYRQSAKNLFAALSTITHVSSLNIERDLANFDKGKHFAFESVADVNSISKLIMQVADLAFASHLEAFDHGLVGDLLEPPFKPNWSFLKMPLVKAIDRHFDYKHERRTRRDE